LNESGIIVAFFPSAVQPALEERTIFLHLLSIAVLFLGCKIRVLRIYLTGAEWHWAPIYEQFVSDAMAGKPLPNFVRGGLKEGFVRMSPYGPAVSQAARNHADKIKAEMMKGAFAIIRGPLKDNSGKIVVSEGKAYPELR
jgi:hypothetical protein